jgi:hypothetical protein
LNAAHPSFTFTVEKLHIYVGSRKRDALHPPGDHPAGWRRLRLPLQALAEFLKAYLIPGSESFLLLGLAAGALSLHLSESAARWGRRWLTLLTALYLALSSPLAARAMEAALDLELNPLTGCPAEPAAAGDRSAWRWHGVLPHSERDHQRVERPTSLGCWKRCGCMVC